MRRITTRKLIDPEPAHTADGGAPPSATHATGGLPSRLLTAYNNAKHRPDQVRLAPDLETYLSAIANYAAMVKRELRTVLK